jgi:hypothetical protein
LFGMSTDLAGGNRVRSKNDVSVISNEHIIANALTRADYSLEVG